MEEKLKVWENRYTVRRFSDQNRTIKQQDLEYLKNVIAHVPTQCAIKQTIWIYLSDQGKDLEFRKWLLDNCFWTENHIGTEWVKEYMLPVYQAPGLLLSLGTNIPFVNIDEPKDKQELSELAVRNEGIYIGVILSELLQLGYQVGTFGCIKGYHKENYQSKYEYFNQYLNENYKKELSNLISEDKLKKTYFDPGVAITFGPEGVPSKENIVQKYENYNYLSYRDTPIKERSSNSIINV